MNLEITPAAAPRFARAKMWWLACDLNIVATDDLYDEEERGPQQYFVEDGKLRTPARYGSHEVPPPFAPGDVVQVKVDDLQCLDYFRRVASVTFRRADSITEDEAQAMGYGERIYLCGPRADAVRVVRPERIDPQVLAEAIGATALRGAAVSELFLAENPQPFGWLLTWEG